MEAKRNFEREAGENVEAVVGHILSNLCIDIARESEEPQQMGRSDMMSEYGHTLFSMLRREQSTNVHPRPRKTARKSSVRSFFSHPSPVTRVHERWDVELGTKESTPEEDVQRESNGGSLICVASSDSSAGPSFSSAPSLSSLSSSSSSTGTTTNIKPSSVAATNSGILASRTAVDPTAKLQENLSELVALLCEHPQSYWFMGAVQPTVRNIRGQLYREVVTEPVYMDKIKRKIRRLEYRSSTEFMHDMERMYENSLAFNGGATENDVTKAALDILETAKKWCGDKRKYFEDLEREIAKRGGKRVRKKRRIFQVVTPEKNVRSDRKRSRKKGKSAAAKAARKKKLAKRKAKLPKGWTVEGGDTIGLPRNWTVYRGCPPTSARSKSHTSGPIKKIETSGGKVFSTKRDAMAHYKVKEVTSVSSPPYSVACYQQKGIKDAVIMNLNIAAAFAKSGLRTLFISANPKNPTVDVQNKRFLAREHHKEKCREDNAAAKLRREQQQELQEEEDEAYDGANATTAAAASRVEKTGNVRDNIGLRNKKLSVWTQDVIPEYQLYREKAGRPETTPAPPTLASYLARSLRSSADALKWCDENMTRIEPLEPTFHGFPEKGMLDVLHAGNKLYEMNARLTAEQDSLKIGRHFNLLFAALLRGQYERIVIEMGPDSSILNQLICMSASYIQISCCPGGFDITSFLATICDTLPRWYHWRSHCKHDDWVSKRRSSSKVPLDYIKFGDEIPRLLPIRIIRYKVDETSNTVVIDHARQIRAIADFYETYALVTRIGGKAVIKHPTLGYVILATPHMYRINLDASNNGLTFFDIAGPKSASGVYINSFRVDRGVTDWNMLADQFRAWAKFMKTIQYHARKVRLSNERDAGHYRLSMEEKRYLRLVPEKSDMSEGTRNVTDAFETHKRRVLRRVDRPGSVIAVVSEGGRGKTSVTIHTSGALAGLGKRVLLIDADGQANASCHLINKTISEISNAKSLERFAKDSESKMEPYPLPKDIDSYPELNAYTDIGIVESDFVQNVAEMMDKVFSEEEILDDDELEKEIEDDLARCVHKVGSKPLDLELYVARGATQMWSVANKFRKADGGKTEKDRYALAFVEKMLNVARKYFDIVLVDLNPDSDAMNRKFVFNSDVVFVPTFPYLPSDSFKELIRRVTIEWPRAAVREGHRTTYRLAPMVVTNYKAMPKQCRVVRRMEGVHAHVRYIKALQKFVDDHCEFVGEFRESAERKDEVVVFEKFRSVNGISRVGLLVQNIPFFVSVAQEMGRSFAEIDSAAFGEFYEGRSLSEDQRRELEDIKEKHRAFAQYLVEMIERGVACNGSSGANAGGGGVCTSKDGYHENDSDATESEDDETCGISFLARTARKSLTPPQGCTRKQI
eukprot:g2071.t1